MKILLVEDDDSLRRVLEYQLTDAGYVVDGRSSVSAGRAALSGASYSLLLFDLQLADGSGLDLLKAALAGAGPAAPCILMTAFATVESAVEALKLGAFDYLIKPFSKDQLVIAIRKALRYASLLEENRRLRSIVESAPEDAGFVGRSNAMLNVLREARQAAASEATVLITGESGTGKELLARAIHLSSPRRDGPFIPISCVAIPEALLESELFGFKKGAFTGAVADRRGRLEEADGGTAFLDEIGDMQPSLQAKLLRLLQEREIQKIGETMPRKLDVRIVAATNRDLGRMVQAGEFREDLYYRLSVIPLNLPPLRERPEDIAPLVAHFLRLSSTRLGRTPPAIDPDAMSCLEAYGWPGNVRELQNVIERIVVMDRDGRVARAALPEAIRERRNEDVGLRFELPEVDFSFEEHEKRVIAQALGKHGWNQSRTARYLGMTRNTLLYRMQKFGLQKG